MTMLNYSASERKLIPEDKYNACLKYEGKVLGKNYKTQVPEVQLLIVVQFDKKNEYGDRNYEKFLYCSLSLSTESRLRKFLKSWRMKDFTEEQIQTFAKQPFDLGRLVNTFRTVRILHETNKGGTVTESIVGLDECSPFKVEWYQDQREKFASWLKEAEEYEAAQRGHKAAAFDPSAPRDEDDTTDYSEEHHG